MTKDLYSPLRTLIDMMLLINIHISFMNLDKNDNFNEYY